MVSASCRVVHQARDSASVRFAPTVLKKVRFLQTLIFLTAVEADTEN
jgi:hypothetical protein